MSFVNSLARIAPLKRFVKRIVDALPWGIRRVLLDLVRNGIRSRPPFEGVYARFEDVKDAAYPPDETRYEFAEKGLSLRRDETTGLVELAEARSLLPLAVAMMAGKQGPLRVLDFGGSGGVDYIRVKETVGVDLRYHIVDIPAICAAGRKLWPDEPNLTFSTTLPEESERFDIVYGWGSVHYVPNPLDLFERFTKYNPAIILIAGSPIGPDAFVRTQVGRMAGQAVKVPHWVLSLPDCEAAMQKCGYKLTFRAVDSRRYNVDNFDAEHRVGNSAILLFRREGAP